MKIKAKCKMERPIWCDWATFDDDGFVNGIEKDAPEDIVKAFQDYQQEKKEQEKKNIKA